MRSLPFFLAFTGVLSGSLVVDESVPEVTLERIAFTSCVKAWRSGQNDLWPQVEKFEPQLFLWTGDAVYANGTGLEDLARGFEEQLGVLSYRHFLRFASEKRVKLDGVWDDHDLGVNDGGREVPNIPERQELFLDFLGLPSEHARRERQGLYKSITYGQGDRKVKVILLDTRSFRSHYVIPSVGAWFHWFPLVGKYMPFLAAVTRFIEQIKFPFTDWSLVDFQPATSTVLGAAQWKWLEGELTNSDAKVHVVISSTVMVTSNPIFEGWSHFPRERDRLLGLLKEKAVPGVVVISGDVHHGEISRAPYLLESSDDPQKVDVVEITASGSTHSLGTSSKTKRLYPPVLEYFDKHRIHETAYYTGLNFGTLEIRWPAEGENAMPEVLLAVRDVHSGSPAVTAQLQPLDEGGSRILSG